MGKANSGSNLRLFLAEDSALIRARLAQMFSVSNVDIVGEAESADDAIAGIQRLQPDVVILDVQLAESSGLQVLREITSTDSDIVFIVCTSYPTPQYRKVFLELGASYFLDKNTEFEKMKQIVEELSAGSTASNG